MKFVFAPGNVPHRWVRGEPLYVVAPQGRHGIGMATPRDWAPRRARIEQTAVYIQGRYLSAFESWLKWWNEPQWQATASPSSGPDETLDGTRS